MTIKREKTMRRCYRVLGICLLAGALALLGAPRNAYALPRIQRYIEISVSPDHLDLGSVFQPGVFDSPATLTVHVAANYNHGGIIVTATPLDGPGGATIPLDRMWVKLPVSGEFVPLIAPVMAIGPMGPGVVDVPLKFRVETLLLNPAGEYNGTITITIGP